MCNQLINNKIDLWERETGGGSGAEGEKTATSWLYAHVSVYCVRVCVCMHVQYALQHNIDPVVEPKKIH